MVSQPAGTTFASSHLLTIALLGIKLEFRVLVSEIKFDVRMDVYLELCQR